MKDFEIFDKTLTLVRYKGKGGNVEIPDGVIYIGHSVFYGCKEITSITIPGSVKSIGSYAFAHCTGLTSIVIPDGVKRIGIGAFENCASLTSIAIPDGVTDIEDRMFEDCTGLTSITLPNSATRIGYDAFAGCSELTSITIPSDVTSIENSAFYGCRGLTSVTIPDSITRIGSSAFYGCTGLISAMANYKAFCLEEDGRLVCRRLHYTVGKRIAVKGDLQICRRGIHYCTNLFDIFNHYSGEYDKGFVIGICEVSNENIGADDDSKRCARWVKPTKILTRKEVINLLNKN